MSERTDSQIIHEAMGLKWLKGTEGMHDPNPNYTTPAAYLEAMAWAKKKGIFWFRFLKWLWDNDNSDTLYTHETWLELTLPDILTYPPSCIPKLASYIKEKGIKPCKV